MPYIKGTDIEIPIDSMEKLKKAAEHYYAKEGKIYGSKKEVFMMGFMACDLFYRTVHPLVDKQDLK